MGEDDPASLKAKISALEAELQEVKDTSAEIEDELNVALEDREEQIRKLHAQLADADDRQKKLTLRLNEAQAEATEGREALDAANEKLEKAKKRAAAAENESERLERLLRQRDFEAERARNEADRAIESAIFLQTEQEQMKDRVRELEGESMHIREMKDAAISRLELQVQHLEQHSLSTTRNDMSFQPPFSSTNGETQGHDGEADEEEDAASPHVPMQGPLTSTPAQRGAAPLALSSQIQDLLLQLQAVSAEVRGARESTGGNGAAPYRRSLAARA